MLGSLAPGGPTPAFQRRANAAFGNKSHRKCPQFPWIRTTARRDTPSCSARPCAQSAPVMAGRTRASARRPGQALDGACGRPARTSAQPSKCCRCDLGRSNMATSTRRAQVDHGGGRVRCERGLERAGPVAVIDGAVHPPPSRHAGAGAYVVTCQQRPNVFYPGKIDPRYRNAVTSRRRAAASVEPPGVRCAAGPAHRPRKHRAMARRAVRRGNGTPNAPSRHRARYAGRYP